MYWCSNGQSLCPCVATPQKEQTVSRGDATGYFGTSLEYKPTGLSCSPILRGDSISPSFPFPSDSKVESLSCSLVITPATILTLPLLLIVPLILFLFSHGPLVVYYSLRTVPYSDGSMIGNTCIVQCYP